MAIIANLTVKKSDGTTDVTFTAQNGAGSSQEPAFWQNTASSTVRSNRDGMTMRSHLNGTKQARRVDVQTSFAVRRTINSVETVVGRIPVDFSVPIPEWATDAEVAEAVDQSINLIASVSIRTAIKSGFAPN